MSINTTLKEIGLNDKEIKLYLTLIKHGRMVPAILAKLTKINRATVYNIAKSLLSRGIIAEDYAGKTLYLTALPPQSLQQIIEKQQRELTDKQKLIGQAIQELSLMTADKKYPVPRIQFIEEDRLEDFLYDNFSKWSIEVMKNDGVWWGFQDHSFVEQYEKWIHWTWEQKDSAREKYVVQLISNMSPLEQKLRQKFPKNKRNIQVIENMDVTSSIWVAGDYIVMIATKQHPFYLFEIHDATLAHNMREMFKKLWPLSK